MYDLPAREEILPSLSVVLRSEPTSGIRAMTSIFSRPTDTCNAQRFIPAHVLYND
jgi:hypothetical protein